jgi:hypothetical protein
MFGNTPRLRLFLQKPRSSSPDAKSRKNSLAPPKKTKFERLEALCNILKKIEPDMNAIQHLLDRGTHNGEFCEEFTPKNQTRGTCGASCPLLDPNDREGIFGSFEEETDYFNIAKQQKAEFHLIISKMKKTPKPRSSKITKWEKRVDELWKGLMAPSEVLDNKKITATQGLNLDWTFSSAWRDSPLMDDKLAPDELPATTEENYVTYEEDVAPDELPEAATMDAEATKYESGSVPLTYTFTLEEPSEATFVNAEVAPAKFL